MGPRAVFLDVGGVFHLPDDGMVAEALEAAGVHPDPSRLERAPTGHRRAGRGLTRRPTRRVPWSRSDHQDEEHADGARHDTGEARSR